MADAAGTAVPLANVANATITLNQAGTSTPLATVFASTSAIFAAGTSVPETGAAPPLGMILSTVTVIDPITIDLEFSIAFGVDAELINLDNYLVEGVGAIDRNVLAIQQTSPTTMRLTIDEMKTGATYEVRVCNLQDSIGLFMKQGPDISRKQFTGAGLPPIASKISPSSPALAGSNIVIDVTDAHAGVLLSSILIKVEGTIAFQGGNFQTGFNGPQSAVATIIGGFRVTIDPETDFAFSQVVDIDVTADDLAGNSLL